MILNLIKLLFYQAYSFFKYAYLVLFVLSNYMCFFNSIFFYINTSIVSTPSNYVRMHKNMDFKISIYVFSTPPLYFLNHTTNHSFTSKHLIFNTKYTHISKPTKNIDFFLNLRCITLFILTRVGSPIIVGSGITTQSMSYYCVQFTREPENSSKCTSHIHFPPNIYDSNR